MTFPGRGCFLARLAAVLLLAWTAADLYDVRLCAADHQFSPTLHISVDAGAAARGQAGDDCFCCSSSVQPRPAVGVCAEESGADADLAVAAGRLLTFQQSLDRPPQLRPR